MKNSNYITITLMIIGIIGGIFISDFFGGYLSGSCTMILLFVTAGRALYKKSVRRTDANNEAIIKTWRNFLNEEK